MFVIKYDGVNSGSGQTPAEMDNGGVAFLDLSKGPSCWADCIYNSFIKLRNNRSVYNVEKFSFDKFRKQLIDLYRQIYKNNSEKKSRYLKKALVYANTQEHDERTVFGVFNNFDCYIRFQFEYGILIGVNLWKKQKLQAS